jgi:hypothetical protein
MKNLIILTCALLFATKSFTQDFATAVTSAKSSYAAGKLEDAHFSLLQAMQEIDLIIGHEVLKLLPTRMDTLSVNTKDDNVMANVGFIGTTIHRSWGSEGRVDLSIIGNSPLVATMNALLNTPMLGGMMSNGNSKIIKISGYKGQLQKEEGSNGETNYNIQIPLGNSLVTFAGKNTTDTQIMAWANTLQLQQIAKLVQ